MLRFLGPSSRLCDGISRREILRVGGLGLLGAGVGLPDLARAAGPSGGGDGSFGRARSCIVLFLMGGPPQHSTWDPKPDAPEQIRGAFGAIATRVPGFHLSELMPQTAAEADKMTGQPHTPMNFENAHPGAPNDSPVLGALVGKLRPPRGGGCPPP